jgi:hypothetical protein
MLRSKARYAVLGLAACAGACRNSDSDSASQVVKVLPSQAGAHGCSAPEVGFTPPPVGSIVALPGVGLDAWSQIAAAKGAQRLYVSCAQGRVVQLDLSVTPPVVTELLAAGVVQAYIDSLGVAATARLSALAVLDATTLLVMEHGSNTLLRLDLTQPGAIELWAGLPSAAPGFADGFAIAPLGGPHARFSFSEPAQICTTAMADGSVFVCDPGNHALRRVRQGFVSTVAGSGTPFFADGSLAEAGLDRPVGLIASCSGRLVVAEAGSTLAGGRRVRQVLIGPTNFFGTSGSVVTLAGNGSPATTGGDGTAASLFAPRALASSSGADTYWIDAGSGILRRLREPQDTVDCPLWSDCAAAVVGGGDFTPDGALSMALVAPGTLYVLDPAAAVLWKFGP